MRNHGYYRVAAAVPAVKVADVDYNCSQIVQLVKQAYENKAEFVVFPELAITAYTCADLFFNMDLQQAAEQGLAYILNATKDLDIVSIIGMPVFDGMNLYNSAVVIQKGKILGVVPKTYLPNNGEFYEARWFVSADVLKKHQITLAGQTAPFTTDILFELDSFRFGIEICEDMWVSTPPSAIHALYGANVIFNLSASNEVIGKQGYRTMVVKSRSFTSHCGYVFVSSGYGESTTDTLFSGHAVVAENGSVLLDTKSDSFENRLFYTEIDTQRIDSDRKKLVPFSTHLEINKTYTTVKLEPNKIKLDTLTRNIAKFPFVPLNPNNKAKRMEDIITLQSAALAKRLLHTGVKHPVIGISGGLDSTLALLVTVKAMDKLKLPHENIIAITMPGFGTTDRTLDNAKTLMQLLGTTVREISIQDACIQHFKDIGHDRENTDVTYENSQARERTQILMDVANQQNGLVIGTGDLSELALGWATYAGDHISMYSVNCGVPKTLVRHLVAWVAESNGDMKIRDVLYDILDTPISPELVPADKDGLITQKTEEILGDYVLHDFFLYYFLRFGFTKAKIQFLAETAFCDDYTPKKIAEVLEIFYKRFVNNQFKRSCMPDGPKIGSVGLSPRSDFRMSSDTSANLWLD